MNFKKGDLIETKSNIYYIVINPYINKYNQIICRQIIFNGTVKPDYAIIDNPLHITNIKNTCNELKQMYHISMKANHPNTNLFQ